MASLRKRNGRFYLLFYSSSHTPKQRAVPIGVVSRKVALRIKVRREEEFAAGVYDPWHTEQPWPALGAAKSIFMYSRRERSQATNRGYESILTRFVKHVGADTLLDSITGQDIEGFLSDCKLRPVSRRTYLNHLSAFFSHFVSGSERKIENPCDEVPKPFVPETFPRFLSPEEVDRLCQHIEASSLSPHVKRGSSLWLIPIIRFAVETGLRRGELVSLRWDSVSIAKREARVVHYEGFRTKGGRDRMVPLTDIASAVLEGITGREGAVFRTSTGSPVNANYLSSRFRVHAKGAGLPGVDIHTLRHTACSWLAMRGVPARVIQQFAGHSSLAVTQRYMHLSDEGYKRWFSRPAITDLP